MISASDTETERKREREREERHHDSHGVAFYDVRNPRTQYDVSLTAVHPYAYEYIPRRVSITLLGLIPGVIARHYRDNQAAGNVCRVLHAAIRCSVHDAISCVS